MGEQKKAKKRSKDMRVLVYDLGGGTFDVSLLNIADGVFETLATCGNTHLGGEDFDRKVMEYIVERFRTKNKKDPTKDRRAMQKLKVAVEEGKRTLSVSVTTTIEVEGFFDGLDLSEILSRSKFEHLNAE